MGIFKQIFIMIAGLIGIFSVVGGALALNLGPLLCVGGLFIMFFAMLRHSNGGHAYGEVTPNDRKRQIDDDGEHRC